MDRLVASLPHNQHDLVVLFCVFLGGVLLVVGSVQVMAVRDLGMMSGLLMIAGFMMFGCLAMMLGRVLMMLRGVLVVLMNLVVVHGFALRPFGKDREHCGVR
jgi:hypothetical protein